VRVGLVADYLEERWPSMDLVAEMLGSLVPASDPGVRVDTLRAPFIRRLGRLAAPGDGGEWTRDRVLNRFWDYPRWLAERAAQYDVLHIVDHSYAHLAHQSSGVPCVVTLHDLDAFRPLLGEEQRGLPKRLVRCQMSGLGRADAVVCVSHAVRGELAAAPLPVGRRVVVIGNGVHPSCTAEPDSGADRALADRLGPPGERVELLHVGSVIPRKRIDVLLRVLAEVARREPDVVLLRVGGALDAGQRREAESLGVSARVVELPALCRRELAAVYRRSALVLLPSDREGFGLPLVEAMACGTPVLASDIPVLREVSGGAAELAPAGDVAGWTARVLALLAERRNARSWGERRRRAALRAAEFSWQRSAAAYAALYRDLAAQRAAGNAGVA
jgi:glycosyltransferase involved in cell wall biosynthesis